MYQKYKDDIIVSVIKWSLVQSSENITNRGKK